MQTPGVKGVMLLMTLSLSWLIELPVSLARTRVPVRPQAERSPAQPPSSWEAESAALRQQLEGQRQLLDTLRGQVEERQVVAEALAARLEDQRAAAAQLSAQVEQLRQDVQGQRYLLYGTLGAMIVSLGLLFSLRGGSPNYRTNNRRILRIRHNWLALQ